MYNNHYVSVLIAAAGQGKRMGSEVNKQYLTIEDKPVLVHTIDAFKESGYIDEIVLIVREEEVDLCKRQIGDRYFPEDNIKIVCGGKERQESIYNGLMAASYESEIVITHDGARPFITAEIINKSLEEVLEFKSVGVGVPVKDTIKVVEKNFIVDTPDRNKLWMIQTPQVFMKNILIEAHNKAKEENYLGTDDCVLVEKLGFKAKITLGSYENIKITTPEDLYFGEAILKNRRRKKGE